MESLLITGSNGFIGSYMVNHLKKTFKIFQTDKTFITEYNAEDSVFMDITDSHLVSQIISKYRPDIVLHLAAIKDVDFCQIYPDQARHVNVNGTKNILDACAEVGVFLIFMSSDYIFEGTTGMYSEEDLRNPSTVYGNTKKESEDIIINSGIRYCIFRSGGVYGNTKRQSSLLTWASERFKRGQVIHAYSNIYNTPTCLYDLCKGVELIAKEHREGIFHIAGCQRVNRSEFLREYALSFGFYPGLVVEKKYEFMPSVHNYKRPVDLSLCSKVSESKLRMKFHGVRDGFDILRDFEI